MVSESFSHGETFGGSLFPKCLNFLNRLEDLIWWWRQKHHRRRLDKSAVFDFGGLFERKLDPSVNRTFPPPPPLFLSWGGWTRRGERCSGSNTQVALYAYIRNACRAKHSEKNCWPQRVGQVNNLMCWYSWTAYVLVFINTSCAGIHEQLMCWYS